MICKIGWEFLSSDNINAYEKPLTDKPEHISSIESKVFYPITFPLTTGAGVLAVLFTLSAHGANNDLYQYLFNIGALLVAVIGVCALIFIFYLNTNRLINYIGSNNEKIINRLMAFLIFCVGLQIASGGIIH